MRHDARKLKQLALSRETLRGLDPTALRQAVGGITFGPNCAPETDQCSNPCTGTNSRCGC